MADLTYTVGFVADTSDLTKKIDVFGQKLKSNTLDLSIAMPKIDTSSAQVMLENIQKDASAMKSVTAETRTLTSATGEQKEVIVALSGEYINLQNQIVKFNTPIENIHTGVTEGSKAFQDLEESASKALNNSINLGTKEKQSIEAVVSKIKEEKALYDSMVAKGDYTGALKQSQNVGALRKELDRTVASAKGAAGAFSSLGSHITNAFKQTLSYATSLGALRAAQKLVNDAVEYNIELNKEMTNIQVLQAEGAQTPEEIDSLANSYNRLAKEMGVSTLEVAKGSVEWLRQGKTIQETQELLRSTMMLSKLGALDSATATDYLTSTLNSYRMATEQATSVVDKLIAVDNASATSSGELATALKYTAAEAQATGVSLDRLISYIGTVSSVTRLNAETIGQQMKTILARMVQMKAGAFDEDGLGINNVELALAKADVKLRDAQGNFRDMGDVLEEVAGKWSTLDEKTQNYISQMTGGIRQANTFNVLMQNMGMALDLQAKEADSAGLAQNRYQIYLKSVEAAQNELTASTQKLYQDAISSGLITSVLNAITSFVDWIDKIGGLKTLAIALATVIAGLTAKQIILTVSTVAHTLATVRDTTATILNTFVKKGQIATEEELATARGLAVTETIAQTVATKGNTVATFISILATEGLNAALASLAINPVGLAIAAITLAVVAAVAIFNTANKTTEELKENFDKLSQSAKDASDAAKTQKEEVETLEELKTQYEDLLAVKERTVEQDKELSDIQKKLEERIPALDTENMSIDDQNTLIDGTVSLLQQEYELKSKIAALDAEQAALAAGDLLGSEQTDYDKLVEDYNNWIDLNTRFQTAIDEAAKGNASNYSGIAADLNALKTEYGSIDELSKKILEAQLNIVTAKQQVIDYWSSLGEEAAQAFYSKLSPEGQAAIDAFKAQQAQAAQDSKDTGKPASGATKEEFARQYEGIKTSLQDIADVQAKVAKGDPFTSEELDKLDALGIAYDIVDGKLQLNTDSLLAYYESQKAAIASDANLSFLQKSKATAMITAAEATAYAASVLDDYDEAVRNAISAGKNTVQISAEEAAAIKAKSDSTYDYSAAITELDGVYTLDIKKLQELDIAKAEDTLRTLEQAEATAILEGEQGAYTDEIAQAKANLEALKAAYAGAEDATKSYSGGVSQASQEQQAYNEVLKATIAMIKQEKKNQEDALKAKLDAYKKIIDAKKKELDAAKALHDYENKVADENKAITDDQIKLNTLELDDSQEAQAQKLEVQADLAEKKKDLENTQFDKSIDDQKAALDQEYDDYEAYINKKIKAIEDYLAKEGQIQQDAMNLLAKGGEELFNKLKKYTETYGSSVDNLIGKLAIAVDYQRQLNIGSSGVKGASKAATNGLVMKVPAGYPNDSYPLNLNVESDELVMVLNKAQQKALAASGGSISSLLPKTANSATSSSSITNISTSSSPSNIAINFNVDGNLDSTVIPDLKALSNQIMANVNKTLIERGNIRSANQTVS